MADEKKGPQEDPILSRLKANPDQPPSGVTSFTGLLGRSSREGHWLLYLGLDMSSHVEINEKDIVHSEQLPPDQSPFGSLGGTRVWVRRDAQITVTQCSSQTQDASAAADEFDLDIRLGATAARQRPILPNTKIGALGTCETCRTQCDTCPNTLCDTLCNQATCQTCRTQCGQNTCGATCAGTCQTCNTCFTCRNTCNTCLTCGNTCQNTCFTCNTCQVTQCNTCNPTCAPTCPDTCRTVCDTCQLQTCQRGCDTLLSPTCDPRRCPVGF